MLLFLLTVSGSGLRASDKCLNCKIVNKHHILYIFSFMFLGLLVNFTCNKIIKFTQNHRNWYVRELLMKIKESKCTSTLSVRQLGAEKIITAISCTLIYSSTAFDAQSILWEKAGSKVKQLHAKSNKC